MGLAVVAETKGEVVQDTVSVGLVLPSAVTVRHAPAAKPPEEAPPPAEVGPVADRALPAEAVEVPAKAAKSDASRQGRPR